MALALNNYVVRGSSYELHLSNREMNSKQLNNLVQWMEGRDVEVLDLADTKLDDAGVKSSHPQSKPSAT